LISKGPEHFLDRRVLWRIVGLPAWMTGSMDNDFLEMKIKELILR
jgi:hypothetical protein